MTQTPRRNFLRQLCGLPLIGGSINLIGTPKAVAEPVTHHLLEAYKTWLDFEQRFLCWEMAKSDDFVRQYYPASAGEDQVARSRAIGSCFAYIGESRRFHKTEGDQPSRRAALVLSAVGCDWRDKERDFLGVEDRVVRL